MVSMQRCAADAPGDAGKRIPILKPKRCLLNEGNCSVSEDISCPAAFEIACFFPDSVLHPRKCQPRSPRCSPMDPRVRARRTQWARAEKTARTSALGAGSFREPCLASSSSSTAARARSNPPPLPSSIPRRFPIIRLWHTSLSHGFRAHRNARSHAIGRPAHPLVTVPCRHCRGLRSSLLR